MEILLLWHATIVYRFIEKRYYCEMVDTIEIVQVDLVVMSNGVVLRKIRQSRGIAIIMRSCKRLGQCCGPVTLDAVPEYTCTCPKNGSLPKDFYDSLVQLGSE
jgi:hypothetical protein